MSAMYILNFKHSISHSAYNIYARNFASKWKKNRRKWNFNVQNFAGGNVSVLIWWWICLYVRTHECVLGCAFMYERIGKNFCHVRWTDCTMYIVHIVPAFTCLNQINNQLSWQRTFYDSLHRNSTEMMRAVYLLPTKTQFAHTYMHTHTHTYEMV